MPLHPALAKMREEDLRSNRAETSAGTVAAARELLSRSALALGNGPPVGEVGSLTIPARAGSLPCRLYHPVGIAEGLVVYLHGGGWLAGTLDGSDALARHLVTRSHCALLLVDYRLAPEHPFPAGLEDAEDALRWAGARRVDLFGRGTRLIAAGDSAGANLATVAARLLKDEVEVALQVLFYPVTDTDTGTASYREHGTGLRLTRNDMRWFMAHYAPRTLWTDPRIAPLRAGDLEGSPPAWIATAEYDVLRDEGEAYAASLAKAGVPVELRRYDGLTHGFARMMNIVDTADQALDEAAAAIARCAMSGSP